MDEIKERFTEIYKLCKEEVSQYKEASEEVRAKIKSLYGLTLQGPLFYNQFNLILFERSDASFFANILPKDALVCQFSVYEFDTHLVVVRYYNDGVLSSIFV
jgi:hypothetical protein